MLDSLLGEPPLHGDLVHRASSFRAGAPNLLFVPNGITAASGGRLKPLADLVRRGQVHTRQAAGLEVFELDKADSCTRAMPAQPSINGRMVVRVFKEGLRETPTAVLTPLDRDLQHATAVGNEEIVFRLVCAVPRHRSQTTRAGRLRRPPQQPTMPRSDAVLQR